LLGCPWHVSRVDHQAAAFKCGYGTIYIADPDPDPTGRVRAFRIANGTITTVAGG